MNRLREIRDTKGYSIRQLATRAGVSTRTILRTEHGQSDPEPMTWRKLADALGTTPEVLQSLPDAKVSIEVNPEEVLDVTQLITAYRSDPGVMGFITRRRP